MENFTEVNYHIMLQDKFIDSYIQDIYEIGEQNNNLFWLRGHKGDTTYIKTNRKIEYLGSCQKSIRSKINNIPCEHNIFIHWYDSWIGGLVYNLPNKLFVYHWGGDFFQEPLWFHAKWIFDKSTLDLIRKARHPIRGQRENKKSRLKLMLASLKHRRRVYNEYKQKCRHVARVDYIVCSEYNTADLLKTKLIYDDFTAIHIPGFYEVNFDLSRSIESQRIVNKRKLSIIVGNSANPSNNHLDAFRKLKNIENEIGIIYCPLAYGEGYYRDAIIECGYEEFGHKFHPIVDYCARIDYVKFLSNVDIAFMYHNRSQAWGTIVTCLTMGKPVFVKRENTIHQFVRSMGLRTYISEDILDYDLNDLIELERSYVELNCERLNRAMSRNRRLSDLKSLLSNY